jgi:hypothetical protein
MPGVYFHRTGAGIDRTADLPARSRRCSATIRRRATLRLRRPDSTRSCRRPLGRGEDVADGSRTERATPVTRSVAGGWRGPAAPPGVASRGRGPGLVRGRRLPGGRDRDAGRGRAGSRHDRSRQRRRAPRRRRGRAAAGHRGARRSRDSALEGDAADATLGTHRAAVPPALIRTA